MKKEQTNINSTQPIGIMDSGVGGLTVAREVRRILPAEDLVYIADNEYFPYGEKTREEVAARAIAICSALVARGCKAIVIACNTATVAGLDAVRTAFQARGYKVPVLGVIHAGAIEAAQATGNGRVGVMATPVTAESKAYTLGIKAVADGEVFVEEVGCPALTDFVENELAELVDDSYLSSDNQNLACAKFSGTQQPKNSQNSVSTKFGDAQIEMARSYLQPLLDAGVDTIVLGCTHYPLAVDLLQQVTGEGVKFVSPSASTAAELDSTLKYLGIAQEGHDAGNVEVNYTGPQDDGTEQKLSKMFELVFDEIPTKITSCTLD